MKRNEFAVVRSPNGLSSIINGIATMTSPPLRAAQIAIDNDAQTFTIIWADRHVTTFPLDGLRRACPCAACQGHEHMDTLPDPALFRLPALMQWKKVWVEPAGHIGLRITWDDGHDTGIYSWKRLRAMCPCDACQARPAP